MIAPFVEQVVPPLDGAPVAVEPEPVPVAVPATVEGAAVTVARVVFVEVMALEAPGAKTPPVLVGAAEEAAAVVEAPAAAVDDGADEG